MLANIFEHFQVLNASELTHLKKKLHLKWTRKQTTGKHLGVASTIFSST